MRDKENLSLISSYPGVKACSLTVHNLMYIGADLKDIHIFGVIPSFSLFFSIYARCR